MYLSRTAISPGTKAHMVLGSNKINILKCEQMFKNFLTIVLTKHNKKEKKTFNKTIYSKLKNSSFCHIFVIITFLFFLIVFIKVLFLCISTDDVQVVIFWVFIHLTVVEVFVLAV